MNVWLNCFLPVLLLNRGKSRTGRRIYESPGILIFSNYFMMIRWIRGLCGIGVLTTCKINKTKVTKKQLIFIITCII